MAPKASDLYGLIVAGGAGTRLWPISRSGNPKQLLSLSGSGLSLLQDSFVRLNRTIAAERIRIVTSAQYRKQVIAQVQAVVPDFPEANLLAEPVGRDSAPAVLWGILEIQAQAPDSLALVVWADGLVRHEDVFDSAIEKARAVAAAGGLAAVGVLPDRPSTMLGYMKLGVRADNGVYQVERFVEKPDLATAQHYLEEGDYVWNPGIFVFNVRTLVQEFESFAPNTVAQFREHRGGNGTRSWNDPRRISDIYSKLKRDSIDYLLLEKTDKLQVVPCELGWSDLGTWDELHRQADKDSDGNAITGQVVTVDTHNSYLSGSKRLITTIGLKDIVVVDTDDALLICDMSRVQDVKLLVDTLKSRKAPEAEVPSENVRPWGAYQVLGEGTGFQVKVLDVNPHAKISLQLHHRRAEHWIVVQGHPLLTLDEEEREFGPNEYLHIPMGAKHRIENRRDEPVRLVEVQYGDYLGEDDIVRFEDVYGRT